MNGEDEFTCRYTVIKHSWKGKYERIFAVGPRRIATIHVNSLSQITNSWGYDHTLVDVDVDSRSPTQFHLIFNQGRKVESLLFEAASETERADLMTAVQRHRAQFDSAYAAVSARQNIFPARKHCAGGDPALCPYDTESRETLADSACSHASPRVMDDRVHTTGTSAASASPMRAVLLCVYSFGIVQMDPQKRYKQGEYLYMHIKAISPLISSGVSAVMLSYGPLHRRHCYDVENAERVVQLVREYATHYIGLRPLRSLEPGLRRDEFAYVRLGRARGRPHSPSGAAEGGRARRRAVVEFAVRKMSMKRAGLPVARLLSTTSSLLLERDPVTGTVVCAYDLGTVFYFIRPEEDEMEFAMVLREPFQVKWYVCPGRDAVLAHLMDRCRCVTDGVHVQEQQSQVSCAPMMAATHSLADRSGTTPVVSTDIPGSWNARSNVHPSDDRTVCVGAVDSRPLSDESHSSTHQAVGDSVSLARAGDSRASYSRSHDDAEYADTVFVVPRLMSRSRRACSATMRVAGAVERVLLQALARAGHTRIASASPRATDSAHAAKSMNHLGRTHALRNHNNSSSSHSSSNPSDMTANPDNTMDMMCVTDYFNANVDYRGVRMCENEEGLFAEKHDKLIQHALEALLMHYPDTADPVLAVPRFFALRRMTATRIGFALMATTPALVRALAALTARSLPGDERQRQGQGQHASTSAPASSTLRSYAVVDLLNTLMTPHHDDYDPIHAATNRQCLLSASTLVQTLLDMLRQAIARPNEALLLLALLEFFVYALCPPHREYTEESLSLALCGALTRRVGPALFRVLRHPCLAIRLAAGRLLRVLMEEESDEAAVARWRASALAEAAYLTEFHVAAFAHSATHRDLARRLLGYWTCENAAAQDLLRRMLPAGLLYALQSTDTQRKDEGSIGSETESEEGDVAAVAAAAPRTLVCDESNASHAVHPGEEGEVEDGGWPRRVFVPRREIASGSHGRHLLHSAATFLQSKVSASYASVTEQPSAALPPEHAKWSHAANALSSRPAERVTCEEHTKKKKEMEMGEEERAAGAAGRRVRRGTSLNWNALFYTMRQPSRTAELIWNRQTREELRRAVETELEQWEQQPHTERDEKGGESAAVSWNYDEFHVVYHSLAQELMVGSYYPRLLFQGGRPSLTQPRRVFDALYHRLLLERQRDREEAQQNCLHAMTALYTHYGETLGVFEDVAEMMAWLDETRQPMTRDGLLLFVASLTRVRGNMRMLTAPESMRVLLRFLTFAHCTHDTTSTPHTDPTQTCTMAQTSTTEPFDSCEHGLGWSATAHTPSTSSFVAAPAPALLSASAITVTVLDMLWQLCLAYPMGDAPRRVRVYPAPAIQRTLTRGDVLPHVVQLLLTRDAATCVRVHRLLTRLLQDGPARRTLYRTGMFYFALLYPASDVRPLARLLYDTHTAHVHRVDSACGGGGGGGAAAGSSGNSEGDGDGNGRQRDEWHRNSGREGDEEEEEESVDAQLSLGEVNARMRQSMLAPLLPPAMIALLVRHGPERFADVFLGEWDSPEAIWGSVMREQLVRAITAHVRNFATRLQSCQTAVYDYEPISPVCYPALQHEMFCGGYYLRHLCDRRRFPDWPVADPVGLLRELLAAWRAETEAAAPPSPDSRRDCLRELGLCDEADTEIATQTEREADTNAGSDDEVWRARIRRAYLDLATRYHPDKNPHGRARFDRIQYAYRTLMAASDASEPCADTGCAAAMTRQALLLGAQRVLYHPRGSGAKLLRSYRYAGYAALVAMMREAVTHGRCDKQEETHIRATGRLDMHSESTSKDSFSHAAATAQTHAEEYDETELVTCAVALCAATLHRCPGNVEELYECGGVSALLAWTMACMRVRPPSSQRNTRVGEEKEENGMQGCDEEGAEEDDVDLSDGFDDTDEDEEEEASDADETTCQREHRAGVRPPASPSLSMHHHDTSSGRATAHHMTTTPFLLLTARHDRCGVRRRRMARHGLNALANAVAALAAVTTVMEMDGSASGLAEAVVTAMHLPYSFPCTVNRMLTDAEREGEEEEWLPQLRRRLNRAALHTAAVRLCRAVGEADGAAGLRFHLVRRGVVWFLLRDMLCYDAFGVHDAAGRRTKCTRRAAPVAAAYALRALSRLDRCLTNGAAEHTHANPPFPDAVSAALQSGLRRLLMPAVVRALRQGRVRAALRWLTASRVELPELVWNASTRKELWGRVAAHTRSASANTNADAAAAVLPPLVEEDFVYHAHRTEPMAGDIFLRVYVTQADALVEEPGRLCDALWDVLRAHRARIHHHPEEDPSCVAIASRSAEEAVHRSTNVSCTSDADHVLPWQETCIHDMPPISPTSDATPTYAAVMLPSQQVWYTRAMQKLAHTQSAVIAPRVAQHLPTLMCFLLDLSADALLRPARTPTPEESWPWGWLDVWDAMSHEGCVAEAVGRAGRTAVAALRHVLHLCGSAACTRAHSDSMATSTAANEWVTTCTEQVLRIVQASLSRSRRFAHAALDGGLYLSLLLLLLSPALVPVVRAQSRRALATLLREEVVGPQAQARVALLLPPPLLARVSDAEAESDWYNELDGDWCQPELVWGARHRGAVVAACAAAVRRLRQTEAAQWTARVSLLSSTAAAVASAAAAAADEEKEGPAMDVSVGAVFTPPSHWFLCPVYYGRNSASLGLEENRKAAAAVAQDEEEEEEEEEERMYGPVIAGVYVGLFLEQSTWPLRHPRDFLVGLLDDLMTHAEARMDREPPHARGHRPHDTQTGAVEDGTAAGSGEQQRLARVGDALLRLLEESGSRLCDAVGSMGYVSRLTALLLRSVHLPCPTCVVILLSVVRVLCRSTTCGEALVRADIFAVWLRIMCPVTGVCDTRRAQDLPSRRHRPSDGVEDAASRAMMERGDGCEDGAEEWRLIVLESMARLVTSVGGGAESRLLLRSVCQHEIPRVLLQMLHDTSHDHVESGDSPASPARARSLRARVMSVLQALVAIEDMSYGPLLRDMVANNALWQRYGSQKHDMFLDEATPTVTGYLTDRPGRRRNNLG